MSITIWDHTSVTCHPTQVNTPCLESLTPARQASTQFTYYTEGWKAELKDHWSEGSLVRRVKCPNPNSNPKVVGDSGGATPGRARSNDLAGRSTALAPPSLLLCFGRSVVWTENGQSILSKIFISVATRWHLLRLKCTKFDFGWGSAPHRAGGA